MWLVSVKDGDTIWSVQLCPMCFSGFPLQLEIFFFLLLSSKLTLSILSVHFSSHYNYECCINSMAGDEAVQLASLPKRQEQFVLTWKIRGISRVMEVTLPDQHQHTGSHRESRQLNNEQNYFCTKCLTLLTFTVFNFK